MEIKSLSLVKEHYHKGRTVLSYDLSYPELSPPSAALRRINYENKRMIFDIVNKTERNVFKAAVRQSEILGDTFSTLSVTASYQTMYLHNGLFSAFTDVFYSLGAEGSTMKRMSQTRSLTSGRQVPLRGLFKGRCDFRHVLFNELSSKISDYEKQNGELCYPDWRAKAMRIIDKSCYYLTDDGIALFFPQGSISAAVWGIPTFLIEYDRLKSVTARRML